MTIGSNIKRLRMNKGITQEQLGEVLGVSSQAVSKWENGIALPDITLAPILARYFGISMDELFGFHLKEDGWVYREWAPGAERLYLTGDFCGWDRHAHPMEKKENGIFELYLSGKDALPKAAAC